jgi:hypothetical protein
MWLSWQLFARSPIRWHCELVVPEISGGQMHLSERASGWIQKIFDSTRIDEPAPAAVWRNPAVPARSPCRYHRGEDLRAISIWRALGWALLLPLLIYAPALAFRRGRGPADSKLWVARGLCLVVWLGILLASFRAGGDQWDNVRYRVMFVGLQVGLAAWVLIEQRRAPDVWLRRTLVATALVLAWFLPWYLRRYIHIPWPVTDPFITLALGLACAVVYWFWDEESETWYVNVT